jgi:serine/tyrosine/threonine adenylyltransferase
MNDALDALVFDNRFVKELPGDPDPSPRPRQVFGAAWSPVQPTPVVAPRLLAHSREAAALLGLASADVVTERFARVFGGNELVPGMEPFAAAYGGHQFGVWAGQLGDGRAITMGEVVNAAGERWELQLKGAGPTPYSRTADGRAVLRSSIREFLCSEAMHHLGVPTTRALSLVGTGESVMRDVMYDGNPAPEPGAVVCRMAPSFLRLGNYELFASRGETALFEQLVDFTIDRDFPHLADAHPEPQARRAAWFAEVCERTAELMVHWMRVGFVHGVMNTDNLSVLGLTIDYGPYGWLDDFDPDWTPNTTDAGRRRYRYGQQPAVAQWNLVRLAEALRGLFPDVAPLEAGLKVYVDRYNEGYRAMTATKFGLDGPAGEPDSEPSRELVGEGFDLLHRAEVDFTRFFRALGEVAGRGSRPTVDDLGDVFYDRDKQETHGEAFEHWLGRWQAAVAAAWPEEAPAEARASMHRVNPKFVLRNWLAQEAIDLAEAGDLSRVHELLDIMRAPYDEQPGCERFAGKRPEWARHRVGCSMLSCSS